MTIICPFLNRLDYHICAHFDRIVHENRLKSFNPKKIIIILECEILNSKIYFINFKFQTEYWLVKFDYPKVVDYVTLILMKL